MYLKEVKYAGGSNATFGVSCRKIDSRWVIGIIRHKELKDYSPWYLGCTAEGEFADVPPNDRWTLHVGTPTGVKVIPQY